MYIWTHQFHVAGHENIKCVDLRLDRGKSRQVLLEGRLINGKRRKVFHHVLDYVTVPCGINQTVLAFIHYNAQFRSLAK